MIGLQFTSIYIKKELYQEYNFTGNNESIDNLSQVNIFIGRNNSGKSRFMRKIFTDDDIKFRLKEIDIEDFDKMINDFTKKFKEITLLDKNHTTNYQNYQDQLQKIQSIRFLEKRTDHSTNLKALQSIITTHKQYGYTEFSNIKGLNLALAFLKKYNETFKNPQNISYHNYSSIYIPTLRGLRPVQTNSSNYDSFQPNSDSYLHRTRFDYFKARDKKDSIYTGLSFYNDIDKYSRGTPTLRKQLSDFKKFLSDTFFNGEKVDLIPNIDDDVVHVEIGNHEEPIHNLGDGIQALIILTYPLFFNQDKVLKVFIEEPETHLHPGYQRILMETLQREEFKHFQYFITTHSNHFLDITLDSNNISVYTFGQAESKNGKPTFSITNVENSDTNVLALIGVQNSSVFLSNCTIWVEGITDRIYLRKYLEIIQKDDTRKQFKEDTHFSFVEYGGNNITHWSFLDSEDPNHANIGVNTLCGKLFLVTDSDSTGFKKDEPIPVKATKKMERLKQLQEKLGERFYCLDVREIENLVMPDILKKTILEYEGKKDEPASINFSKLKYETYKSEKIGQFIDTYVKDSDNEKLKRKYASDSGTISDKVTFAKKVVGYINTKSDMSEEAIGLAEKLYSFIKGMNK